MTTADYNLAIAAESNVEAEQSVLGSMLWEPNCIVDVMAAVTADDFAMEQNRHIFEAIVSVRRKDPKPDLVKVLEEMRGLGTYADEIRKYILQLGDITPTAANVMEYAKIVREHSARRRMKRMAAEILADQGGTSSELLKRVNESAARELERPNNGGLLSSNESMALLFQSMEDRANGKVTAVSTGFKRFDQILGGGFVPQSLNIMAARPGMGKTTVALNIAEQIQGAVLFITLEMSNEQLDSKRLSRATIDRRNIRSGIQAGKLLTGNDFAESDWGTIAEASLRVKGDLYVNDTRLQPQMKVADIQTAAMRIPNLKLIIIDYLGLILPDGKPRGAYEDTTNISRQLKALARQMGTPILCLCQLNRVVESRDDKRPRNADLRDSGGIEQDADTITMLYRDDYYTGVQREDWEPSLIEMNVSKNRHGRTGVGMLNAFMAKSLVVEPAWRGGRSTNA